MSAMALLHVLVAFSATLPPAASISYRKIIDDSGRLEALPRNFLKSAAIGDYGFDEAGQDSSVSPGDNFFSFASGKYIENLTIPEDESSWGNFDILSRQSLERVRGILEDDVKSDGKMGRFYASFMNAKSVDSLDTSPIKSTLAEIAAVNTSADYAMLSARATRGFLPAPVSIGISANPKDVEHYCVTLDQGGISMPKEYYLDKQFASKKAAYKTHAAKLLEMVGWPEHEKASKDILELEYKLANASWSQAQLRSPIDNYNPMSGIDDLKTQAPGFDWAVFLKQAGLGHLPKESKLVVGALGAVKSIAKILGETDMGVLRSHAAFHFVSQVSPFLSERFINTSFQFSKVMTGQKVLSPRWKRGVRVLNEHMGEAVGKSFVKLYFPAKAKAKVELLTTQLKDAFKRRLQKVEWMQEATKKKALAKLDKFSIMVGYPKKFRNYDELIVDKNDLYGNMVRSYDAAWDWYLGKLGTKVDKDEWEMTPQTVNAYNMPPNNQVVFPAAILQPPFFDAAADMAVNFGGIGAVIGHEMTHGFDDQGRHYDEGGQLKDWWTDADVKAFQSRAKQYGAQFEKFDLGVPGAHIKADLTMGEDIADLGGLTLALDAYNTALAANGTHTASVKAEGARRVFLGWA